MLTFVQRVRRNPVFIIGICTFLVALIAFLSNLNSGIVSLVPKLQWQIVTGLSLVGILGFQWGLFLHRFTQNQPGIQRHYRLHKIMGIAFMIVFVLHADRIGYAWMMALSCTLIALVLTGLFNREIVAYRKPWIYKTWLWLHVALAALLMPFVVMHSMVALTFE